jgi:hypothetical protein
MKGASFVSEDFLAYVSKNTTSLFLISVVFWSVLMYVCYHVFRVNILRIVVLFGTFALAMAFAGNDLVNFIGVPIAGLESYLAWSASGSPSEAYEMSILNTPIRTQNLPFGPGGFNYGGYVVVLQKGAIRYGDRSEFRATRRRCRALPF